MTIYGDSCTAAALQPHPLGAPCSPPPTATPPPGGAVQPNPCAATPPGGAAQPNPCAATPYNPPPPQEVGFLVPTLLIKEII